MANRADAGSAGGVRIATADVTDGIRDWLAGKRSSLAHGRRRMATSGTDGPSLALVHYADRSSATWGDTITFTAWILNDSKETLADVSLIPWSLRNSVPVKLTYRTGPSPEDLSISFLAPGESAKFGFTYMVSYMDMVDGGEIVSAMEVRARSNSRIHRDECAAVVRVYVSNG